LGAPYGTTTDIWSVACLCFELLTGDFLFDPKSGKRYTKEDDHITQIMELVGPNSFPKKFALSGTFSKEIFTRRGELRHIHKLRYWKLDEILVQKYKFSSKDAGETANFLMLLLKVTPTLRYVII
jgi:serine/threonine protein kinase